MDLQTIEMPGPEARRKFLEYRNAVRRRHIQEDTEIMRGYRQLASGHRVLKLADTLRDGGVQLRSGVGWNRTSRHILPRLAIALADQSTIYIQGVNQNGGMTYFWNENLNPHATAKNVILPNGTFDLREIEDIGNTTTASWRETWTAQVPHVPPSLRPDRGLRGYHILWEATWHQARPRPAKDPALLKHIGGDLYAVVAIWDLTDLERAVLATGRRQGGA